MYFMVMVMMMAMIVIVMNRRFPKRAPFKQANHFTTDNDQHHTKPEEKGNIKKYIYLSHTNTHARTHARTHAHHARTHTYTHMHTQGSGNGSVVERRTGSSC